MLLLFCVDSIEKLLALPAGNPGRIRNMRDRELMKSNISQSQKDYFLALAGFVKKIKQKVLRRKRFLRMVCSHSLVTTGARSLHLFS
jgi:hypothetical protein